MLNIINMIRNTYFKRHTNLKTLELFLNIIIFQGVMKRCVHDTGCLNLIYSQYNDMARQFIHYNSLKLP